MWIPDRWKGLQLLFTKKEIKLKNLTTAIKFDIKTTKKSELIIIKFKYGKLQNKNFKTLTRR